MHPASISYSDEVKRWFWDNQGHVIAASDVPTIYKTAFKTAAKPETIINGFKEAGICPLDRTVYADKDFVAAKADTHKSTKKYWCFYDRRWKL